MNGNRFVVVLMVAVLGIVAVLYKMWAEETAGEAHTKALMTAAILAKATSRESGVPPTVLAAEAPEFAIEMTDGYFQVDGREPRHLMHGPERQSVALGKNFTVWLHLALRQGAASPCSSRDEVACIPHSGILANKVDGTPNKLSTWKHEERYDTGESTSMAVPQTVARDLALGDADYIIWYTVGNEVVFEFTIPLRIEQ